MKCCHTMDGFLPPCLGDSGGSDAPSSIGAAGLGGLGLALPGLGGAFSLRDMDKHPAGPRDCTVLTRQAEHRSSWLWDGPPAGQAWPGVLTCRHRFSCMPKVGFPHICPVMRHPHQALPLGPLAVRWKVATCTTEHATHVLSAYRMSLASLRPNQIVWEPYKSVLVANAPIFEGEMRFDDEYMEWFRRITRRFITKETSYWDTLVESHLRILAMCTLGSAIHTECMSALEAVEELSRLNLDNARAVSNTSEPPAGCGRLVGGRRGRGGRQSGDGKVRRDKEPVRRRKRE
ncbi:hypothetical protein CMV_015673 [Castanea mollissima]|uniref:Aminotransferase-like plant mobile domain-containing protein n=1 Tax=Castanea mollissima TaxID=60419 RepID=A0A8J4R9W6_9ROSI|nr:hypothetical protein CMV_015673 [Castanea mollissima]